MARVLYYYFITGSGFSGILWRSRCDGRKQSQLSARCRIKPRRLLVDVILLAGGGASTPGSLCPLAGGCCASPAPPGDRPKAATALYRARIKAYFCLDEFNGNFVFKWSGSPAGFLPLEFLLSGVCVQKCCLPPASRDSNISRLLPAHPGRWGSSLQKVPA